MNGGSRTDVVRIAVDAMGGDHAPHEIVKGAVLAAAEYPIEILLVGQEEVVHKALAETGSTARNIEVVDAREVVEMEDTALAPLRRKRNSSVRVCAISSPKDAPTHSSPPATRARPGPRPVSSSG